MLNGELGIMRPVSTKPHQETNKHFYKYVEQLLSDAPKTYFPYTYQVVTVLKPNCYGTVMKKNRKLNKKKSKAKKS